MKRLSQKQKMHQWRPTAKKRRRHLDRNWVLGTSRRQARTKSNLRMKLPNPPTPALPLEFLKHSPLLGHQLSAAAAMAVRHMMFRRSTKTP